VCARTCAHPKPKYGGYFEIRLKFVLRSRDKRYDEGLFVFGASGFRFLSCKSSLYIYFTSSSQRQYKNNFLYHVQALWSDVTTSALLSKVTIACVK
jgi:hypothetical protein